MRRGTWTYRAVVALVLDRFPEEAMRSIPPLLVAALLAGCGTADEQSDVDMPDAQTPAAEESAAPMTLADVAGTWETVVTLEGVEEPVPATIGGSAAGDDWTMSLEGRPGIPLEVSVVGDSVIMVSEEYESILRPGVMVSARTAGVIQNGTLVGNVVTTYRTDAGEERVPGTFRSTRVQ
ncbi:MAG: hypothetical protein WEB88_04085 [Gemmatimonadota bacterium]